MVPPGLPSPWPKRRGRLRWLRSVAESFNLWGLTALLLAGAVLWMVSSMEVDQTVEGTVETRALSFQLHQSTEDVASAQPIGFLKVDVRTLEISGLRDGTPVSFRLKNKALQVGSGDKLTFTPPAGETFELKLLLPSGTRVENLHGEDQQELVVDLRSPIGTKPSPARAIELSINPPAAPEDSRREPAQGQATGGRSGLQAVQKTARAPERILPTPEATFSLLLEGDARLRLRLANPSLVFEPNLPVREVKFYTVKASAFREGENLVLSSVSTGTLHFGRREPLQLRENQFLRMDAPGILKLTDLRLVNDNPLVKDNSLVKNKLIVFVSGQTNRLSAGLSPERASTELKGTLLSRHLSPEQITGFYGFMAGLIGSMVLVFFRAH